MKRILQPSPDRIRLTGLAAIVGGNAARFLLFSAVIVLGAVGVIVATRGRFAHATAPVGTP